MNRTAAEPSGYIRPTDAGRDRRQSGPRPRHLELAIGLAAGVVLGVVDLIAQRSLPYPWANLANSGAVWALGAFVMGRWVGPWPARAAAAGIGLLLVAVESYYLCAVVVQGDDISNLWTSSTVAWLVLAVIVGGLLGAAGAASVSSRRSVQLAGTGLIALVFVAEAVRVLHRATGSGADSVHDRQTALILLGVAVLVTGIVLAPRSWRPRRNF